MVGFEGLTPPDYILDWLAEGRIGGVYLFSRNVDNPHQVAQLTRLCHEAARFPILIGIDQEGGVVARLRAGYTESPGAMALGAAGSENLAERMSEVLAVELRALGINWNYAPVLDITHDIHNPSVGTRSLGSDPRLVSRLGVAQIRGFQRIGVAACAKHFPGLGMTPVDTHEAVAVISAKLDFLWEHELIPFCEAIRHGVATVMTTHVIFEALDSKYPATLSPVVVQKLLRDEIGFSGVVATDCMEMKAITDLYDPGESAVLAAEAGIDLIQFSHTKACQEMAYNSLREAVDSGRISLSRIDESVQRIAKLKKRFMVVNNIPLLDVIQHPDHLAVANEAARSGMVVLRSNSNAFPLRLNSEQKIVLVEFASYLDCDVMEQGGQTAFALLLRRTAPQIESIALRPLNAAPADVEDACLRAKHSDLLILATRSAHLIPDQLEMANRIMHHAKEVVLLCLQSPYDSYVLQKPNTVICACGDSTPSLKAAIDLLLGEYESTGNLPVPVG